MLIPAFLLGALLSLAVCALLWGTGRRPYLRVDLERHETRQVVHHLIREPEPQGVPLDSSAAPTRSALEQTPPAVLPTHITEHPRHATWKDTYR